MQTTQTTKSLQNTRRDWTYADYLRLEDSPRYEVLSGELHSVPAPDVLHQRVVRDVSVSLWEFVREHRCGEVFWSPIDVILGRKQTTVVQPDVVFVAAGKADRILRQRGIFGAPDLLIEVLSPATTERDCVLKKALYEAAGVMEYWVLDPLHNQGFVYHLEKTGARVQYRLSASVNTKTEPAAELASRVLPGWRFRLNRLDG